MFVGLLLIEGVLRLVEPTPEWVDTFSMYAGVWIWLDEPQFLALRPSQRRSLMAVRRRSVRPKLPSAWPSELAAAGDRLLLDWIASGTSLLQARWASRHRRRTRKASSSSGT